MCRILAECTANCHPCKPSILPTRLIDIGTSLCDIPRLVVSSDSQITAETKYAALSSCWGDKEDAKTQLKIERATLEQRLKGIYRETMTPAIRDAVELTRAVGLRYIWIDPLCIVQDDTTDWSYESGQMITCIIVHSSRSAVLPQPAATNLFSTGLAQSQYLFSLPFDL